MNGNWKQNNRMLALDFPIQSAGEAGQKPWDGCQTMVLAEIHGFYGRCRDPSGFGDPSATFRGPG
jgi:hypothetical protein